MKECQACSGTGRQFIAFRLTGELCPVCEGSGDMPGSAFEFDSELTGEAEHAEHELGASYGDPYHCPRHPQTPISDAYGLHSWDCSDCEGESDEAAERWAYDPANPHRTHCELPDSLVAPWDMRRAVTCQDVSDPNEIMF